jgi:aconitase B
MTVGGANPGNVFRAGDHFRMQVAEGRAINPITKTNWEGTGVHPDVPVQADLALATAQLLALKGREGKLTNAEQKEEVEKAERDAQGEIDRRKRTR